MLSRRFRLNWTDLLHGLFAAVIGSVIGPVLSCLQDGWPSDWEPCGHAAIVGAIIGGLSYIGKAFGTNRDNELFQPERYLIPDPRGGMPTVGRKGRNLS